MSLASSWKLMSLCTVATAANAASTAASISAVDAPATAISTKVPSSGRAQRMLSGVGGIFRLDGALERHG